MKNKNMNLYFKGLSAIIIQFGGAVLLAVAVMGLSLGRMNTGKWIIGLFGVVLIIYGKAKRFDYKRRSGAIIHAGDGWR